MSQAALSSIPDAVHIQGIVHRKRHFPGFYTYTHARPDGRVFYVGKGAGRRAWIFDVAHRSTWHLNIVKKYGRRNIIVTIYPALSEADAFADEIRRIEEMRSSGIVLVNRTDGGEGPSGLSWDQSRIENHHAAILEMVKRPSWREAHARAVAKLQSDPDFVRVRRELLVALHADEEMEAIRIAGIRRGAAARIAERDRQDTGGAEKRAVKRASLARVKARKAGEDVPFINGPHVYAAMVAARNEADPAGAGRRESSRTSRREYLERKAHREANGLPNAVTQRDIEDPSGIERRALNRRRHALRVARKKGSKSDVASVHRPEDGLAIWQKRSSGEQLELQL